MPDIPTETTGANLFQAVCRKITVVIVILTIKASIRTLLTELLWIIRRVKTLEILLRTYIDAYPFVHKFTLRTSRAFIILI